MTVSTSPTSSSPELAEHLLDQVDSLLQDAEERRQPLEIEPYRGRLFELFVTAEAAGYVSEGADSDLTADGLCRVLAGRWGLRSAAQDSFQSQTRMPPGQLQKMRGLWSMMRMWMEWTYAWQRWEEFHGRGAARE